MRGIRGRLAVALVALVAATVLAIGVGTYAFVDARLRDTLLADATRQAQFNLSVLVPGALHAGATSHDFQAAGLPAAFRLRGDVEEIADFGGKDVYASTLALSDAEASLPTALTDGVAAGRLSYAWLTIGSSPSLVVGGRASLDGADGPSIYFVFPAMGIDDALAQLRLGLLAAGLVALVVALGTAGLISRGLLRPVRSGSLAAARIAGGDLAARVPVFGADELADWAVEFNRMADSLAATIQRLEDSESRNRQFVAEVSHEL
ncbi:MAG TPA: HAMP domain-containing protein, partial [Candidatus Limnocylindrales bacterium]|nr:HAMP domain-containing protein [Candidatus Limnocylindrales bacterium]